VLTRISLKFGILGGRTNMVVFPPSVNANNGQHVWFLTLVICDWWLRVLVNFLSTHMVQVNCLVVGFFQKDHTIWSAPPTYSSYFCPHVYTCIATSRNKPELNPRRSGLPMLTRYPKPLLLPRLTESTKSLFIHLVCVLQDELYTTDSWISYFLCSELQKVLMIMSHSHTLESHMTTC